MATYGVDDPFTPNPSSPYGQVDRRTGWGQQVNDAYKRLFGSDATDQQIWSTTDQMKTAHDAGTPWGNPQITNWLSKSYAPAFTPNAADPYGQVDRRWGWGKEINDIYKSHFGADASDLEIWNASNAMAKEQLSADQIYNVLAAYRTAHQPGAGGTTPGAGGTAPGGGSATPGGTGPAGGVATPSTPGAKVAGALYAAQGYTGDQSGAYGKWLAALSGVDTSEATLGDLSEEDQFRYLIDKSGARGLLSPYYLHHLQNQLGQAQANYNLQAALGGGDTPTQAGTGADETFSQYLQDTLVGQGNAGKGGLGWGSPVQADVDVNAFIDRLAAGQGAAAETPEGDLWAKYADDPAMLRSVLGANLQGPWAQWRRQQLQDKFAGSAGEEGSDAFLNALRAWQDATYGART